VSPITASLTRPAERSLSSAEAMYLVFLVAKALLSGFGSRRRHRVFARPVSSNHMATLSQTSLSTSTIKVKRKRGGYMCSHKLCLPRLCQCAVLKQTERAQIIRVRATLAKRKKLSRETSERGLSLPEYLCLKLLG